MKHKVDPTLLLINFGYAFLLDNDDVRWASSAFKLPNESLFLVPEGGFY